MAETCLKRFNVAIEVANFVCYIKYVDKNDDGVASDLVDDLYDLVQYKDKVEKKDINKLVRLYSHQLTPKMLKEEKFNIPYNAITNQFMKDEEVLNPSYDAPFVISLKSDLAKRYHKEEFMNHFTDMYKDSLFLIDVRYYDIEKRYYNVEFELCLSSEALTLRSNDSQYIALLEEKYSLNQIIEKLDLNYEFDQKVNMLTTDLVTSGIESVYPFSLSTVLDKLVESYDDSHCIFINNVFLKSLNLGIDNLLKPQTSPKLIVILEGNEYSYFDQRINKQIDRIEHLDGNTIVHISEHLFRESCGNLSYILMMNNKTNITLNQLGSDYHGFPFIAKNLNKNLNLFKDILNKYFEAKQHESYLDNLLLLTFILDDEEINSNLNYYLVNSLKTNALSFLRINHDSRESLPFGDLKKLLHIHDLSEQLSKSIVLNSNNLKLILNDMVNMISKLSCLEDIDEFENVMKDIVDVFNIDKELFDEEIMQINTLIGIKRVILTKEQDINFILDTSVLMDEPDLFHKYFNDKSIIVPSIIKDELERNRVNNINAVRAIRNINMLKNNSNIDFQYVNIEDNVGEMNRPIKIKVLEDLMHQFTDAGKRSILVSNDLSRDLYKNNKDNIIQLKHIPLLYK